MDGRMGGKAGLRIAYSNQKCNRLKIETQNNNCEPWWLHGLEGYIISSVFLVSMLQVKGSNPFVSIFKIKNLIYKPQLKMRICV